jgi:hypothetical protein
MPYVLYNVLYIAQCTLHFMIHNGSEVANADNLDIALCKICTHTLYNKNV